jgi:hypothetical protein
VTRRLAAAAAIALVLAAAACGGHAHHAAQRAPTQASAGLPLPAAAGPLGAVAHWRGGRVPVGTLLLDDGRRLWSVALDGTRRLLWTHPRLDPTGVAAGPGGNGVALAGEAVQGSAATGFLYLLGADGSVKTVDVARNGGTISGPQFLRAPTQPTGPVRLYWIHELDASQFRQTRPWDWKQVWLLDGTVRRRVTVHLRLDEYPYELHGYAGSPLFSLTTFRRDNSPTRDEVMFDNDSSGMAFSSLVSLGHFNPLVNTDLAGSVAWTGPRDAVVEVVQLGDPSGYQLRLYRVGCQYDGFHLVHMRSGIDFPSSRVWQLLPGGPHSVLVVGRGGDVWTSIDVRSGRAAPTRVAFAVGAWAFVQPPVDTASLVGGNPGCSAYSWRFH